MKVHFAAVSFSLMLCFIWTAQADDPPPGQKQDIMAVLKANGNFSILVSALEQTGLDATLRQNGAYTFFAPTDAAFQKITNREVFLRDTPQLLAVLNEHIVASSRIASKDLIGIKTLTSLQGTVLNFRSADGLTVNGTRIVQTDLSAGNGIIHAVDSVFFTDEKLLFDDTRETVEDNVKANAFKVYSGLKDGMGRAKAGILHGAHKIKNVFSED